MSVGGLLVFGLIMWVAPVVVGQKLGKPKGRRGWLWGLVLGWLGVLIVACLGPTALVRLERQIRNGSQVA